jgi:hypothetical protein
MIPCRFVKSLSFFEMRNWKGVDVERRNSELAKDAAKFHELWIQRKSIAKIAGEMGLNQKAVRSRLSYARRGYANRKPQDARADAAAWLDDVIRRCYAVLQGEQELRPMEYAAFLKLIADTAVREAELYGPVTGAGPEFEERE